MKAKEQAKKIYFELLKLRKKGIYDKQKYLGVVKNM